MAVVSALISFCVHFVEHFTGSIVEETLERSFEGAHSGNELEDVYIGGEDAPLLTESNYRARDFTRYDSTDCVYEEYRSPSPSNDRFAWKQGRPSACMSVIESIKTVSGVSALGGVFVGLMSVLLLNVSLNTVDLCHWKDDKDETLPRFVENIRFVSYVFTSPFIYCYQTIVFVIVFKWSVVKEQNLLVISLLASFVDIFYRLLLRLFSVYTYKSFELPYPVNVLFVVTCFANGYLVSRTKHPNSATKTLILCFKLCVQFLAGIPLIYIILYVVCRWYPKLPHRPLRMVLVGATGMIVLIFKMFTRLCVGWIKGIIHPGSCYILISVLYGACSIILRIMQSEQEHFDYFFIIGVAHGIVFVLERAAVPLTDFLLLKFFKWCVKGRYSNSSARAQYKTPRSQRLIADVSIQAMMFESCGLIISLGAMLLYKLLYAQLTAEDRREHTVEFLKRMSSGLVIEWVFNVVAVFIQTRFMNIAIFSVWKLKWKCHMLVGAVTSAMTILCFTSYLLQVVRSQEQQDILARNCTVLPFSTY